MNKQEYNGWTNYETWNCKLWLDNDAGLQDFQKKWLETAKNTPKVDVWTIEETVKFTLADLIKEFVVDNVPDIQGMYADLLNAAICEINFNEIAENIIKSD